MRVGDIVKVTKPRKTKGNFRIRRRPRPSWSRQFKSFVNAYGIITRIDDMNEPTYCSIFIKGRVFYARVRNLKVVA